MATLEIPVVIDGVKSIEELANRVLNEYEYHGRTIREWADRIAHPETNGDRIRSMTDEELADKFGSIIDCVYCPCHDTDDSCNTMDGSCQNRWLNWLKEEAKNENI